MHVLEQRFGEVDVRAVQRLERLGGDSLFVLHLRVDEDIEDLC